MANSEKCKKLRTGQEHPRANLTDREVELMRTMHEEEGLGYKRLARLWETPVRTVRNICGYRRR